MDLFTITFLCIIFLISSVLFIHKALQLNGEQLTKLDANYIVYVVSSFQPRAEGNPFVLLQQTNKKPKQTYKPLLYSFQNVML